MSIGVIGGADGPTAIFVSGGPDWFAIGVTALAVAGATALVVWLVRRRRKGQE